MKKERLIIYWARRDLRLRDNRAFGAAAAASRTAAAPLLPLFFVEPYMTRADAKSQFGYPSRYFLAKALPLFAERFPTFGLYHEKPAAFFKRLAAIFDLDIYVNEDVHPDFYTQIRKIRDGGISIKLFRDQLTVSKETVTGSGSHYSVFTPFENAVWTSFVEEQEDKTPNASGIEFKKPEKAWGKLLEHADMATLHALFETKESISVGTHIIDISKLGLPQRDLSGWYVSESQALRHFDAYLKHGMSAYKDSRNELGTEGTSRMSLALAWGLVSARTLVSKIKTHFDDQFANPASSRSDSGALTFISELIWREFYKYLWFHRPELFTQPFQEKRRRLAWAPDKEALKRFIAWITGKTGYPLVDAAMMQLARTGWMHNRTRMVVASVLTKNLGVNWMWGQEYFRAMLIDLDEASNNGGWQWGASVGADPKPIRIFNPYLQAKNFDPEGAYQKEWLDSEYLAKPPTPIIPHQDARTEALARYGLGRENA